MYLSQNQTSYSNAWFNHASSWEPTNHLDQLIMESNKRNTCVSCLQPELKFRLESID